MLICVYAVFLIFLFDACGCVYVKFSFIVCEYLPFPMICLLVDSSGVIQRYAHVYVCLQ